MQRREPDKNLPLDIIPTTLPADQGVVKCQGNVTGGTTAPVKIMTRIHGDGHCIIAAWHDLWLCLTCRSSIGLRTRNTPLTDDWLHSARCGAMCQCSGRLASRYIDDGKSADTDSPSRILLLLRLQRRTPALHPTVSRSIRFDSV